MKKTSNKTSIFNPFTCLAAAWACGGVALTRSRVLPALAALSLISVGATGQTFTILHSFTATTGPYPSTNTDGADPQAGLIINSSGNILYGEAAGGGSSGRGTVFAVNTDGSGFTNVYSFTAAPNDPSTGFYTNRDGIGPGGGLILRGNTLYGTAGGGGSSGVGTVFAVKTDGAGFTNLHSFTVSEGVGPQGLILSGQTLYGTAYEGGISGAGTVFKLNTNGTGFTTLYRFTAGTDNGNGSYTNRDGSSPSPGLVLSGNTLYGTARYGGSSGIGTVFAVSTNGTGFTTLHSFTGGSDGAGPYAGLILSGTILYGTAGGGNGTVFAVQTNGTAFTTLHNFTGGDGGNPRTGLVLSGNTLYGTAAFGGSANYGTLFAVNINGAGFTNLYSFAGGSDGGFPYAGLSISGNTLYGTAVWGGSSAGSSGNGTVFSLSFRPQLTITPSGVPPSGIILTWPTNVAGFDYTGYTLQSTTNLVSPVVWSTNSPAPIVVAGQNTVTNPITGPQKFFRLIH